MDVETPVFHATEGEIKVNEKQPELSIFDAGVIQPWGVMNQDTEFDAAMRVPSDWQPFEGATLSQRIDHFEAWMKDTFALVNTVLWPRYDPKRQVWIGESTAFMKELMQTDLELMLDLQHPPSGIEHFRSVFKSLRRTLSLKSHWSLFRIEDGSGIFDNFPLYCRDAPEDLKSEMSSLCFSGDSDKQAPVNFRFKNSLQRPRPMQMAQRFALTNFLYEDAASSISPSMCSGHCLQGVLEVAAALERILDDELSLSEEQLLSIGQWGVDIGDRRVMAGIHYPGDNISSWLIFLRMSDFVFHQSYAPQVMAYAIRKLSFIYRELHRWKDSGRGAVYISALNALDQELDRVLYGFTLQGVPAKQSKTMAVAGPGAVVRVAAAPARSGNLEHLDEVLISRGGVGTTLGVRRFLDLHKR